MAPIDNGKRRTGPRIVDTAPPLIEDPLIEDPLVMRKTQQLGGYTPGGGLPMTSQSESNIRRYQAGEPGYKFTGPGSAPIGRHTIIEENYRRMTDAKRLASPAGQFRTKTRGQVRAKLDPDRKAAAEEQLANAPKSTQAGWTAEQKKAARDARKAEAEADFTARREAINEKRAAAGLDPKPTTRAEVREETNRKRLAQGLPPLGLSHEEYRKQQGEKQAAAHKQQEEMAELDRKASENKLFERRVTLNVESRERDLRIKKAEGSMDVLREKPEAEWTDENRALFNQNETNLREWYREAAIADEELEHEKSETKKGEAYVKAHGQPYTRMPFGHGPSAVTGAAVKEPQFGEDMQAAMAEGARGAPAPVQPPETVAPPPAAPVQQPRTAAEQVGQRLGRAVTAGQAATGRATSPFGMIAGQASDLATGAFVKSARAVGTAFGEAARGYVSERPAEPFEIPGYGEVQDATFTPQGLDSGTLPDGREVRGATLNGVPVFVIIEPGVPPIIIDEDGEVVQR